MGKRHYMLFMLAALTMTLAMSANVFAASSFDMTAAITTTVGELTTQFWAIIGIVIPAVLVIVGGRLVVTKGISWFKSLTGKA